MTDARTAPLVIEDRLSMGRDIALRPDSAGAAVEWMAMEVDDAALLLERAVARQLRVTGEWLRVSPLPNVTPW